MEPWRMENPSINVSIMVSESIYQMWFKNPSINCGFNIHLSIMASKSIYQLWFQNQSINYGLNIHEPIRFKNPSINYGLKNHLSFMVYSMENPASKCQCDGSPLPSNDPWNPGNPGVSGRNPRCAAPVLPKGTAWCRISHVHCKRWYHNQKSWKTRGKIWKDYGVSWCLLNTLRWDLTWLE